MSSGLVGMIARREGVDLGVVVHVRGCVAYVRQPDGHTYGVQFEEFDRFTPIPGVTFHPAAPADPKGPSKGFVRWANRTIKNAADLRATLRSTLGLAADASDEGIVEAIGRLVRDHAAAPRSGVIPIEALAEELRRQGHDVSIHGNSVVVKDPPETTIEWSTPGEGPCPPVSLPFQGHEFEGDDGRDLCLWCSTMREDAGGFDVSGEECAVRLRGHIGEVAPSAPAAPEGPAMTSEPPPPAPDGEERWYRHTDAGRDYGFPFVAVRGDRWNIMSENMPGFGPGEVMGSWDPSTELRSVHPVLPPLWASESWTSEPLPAAPEAGSVWWGWVSADGDIVEVLEQASSGFRSWSKKGYGPGKKRLCSVWTGNATLRASEAADPGARRTVSPIARPEWCR